MYDALLVPTDGSDHAVRAAAHAAYLADVFDGTVILLNVVDLDIEAGLFSAGGINEAYLERLLEHGRDTVEETDATIHTASSRTEVVTGRPTAAILEYITEEGIDIVVMGTHGRTGIRRHLMGSVAERVVALADVPVVTTRATDDDTPVESYEEILIATDDSQAATESVEHAMTIATQTGAQVHALNVVPAGSGASNEPSMPDTMRSDLESAGEVVTGRIANRAENAHLDAVSAVRTGPPVETLLDYADEHDIDLIAMGTTGRTGLSRFLLGSTTEKVLRQADVPVLAVTPQDQEK